MTEDDKAMVPRDVAESWKAKAENLSAICKERATRIEQLTAEVERLRAALQSVTPPPHFGESEQNKAWWAKARAALENKQ